MTTPPTVSIWGVPTSVVSWRTPESPTARLRKRLRSLGLLEAGTYGLAVAANSHRPAEAFVGVKATVRVGERTPEEAPALSPEEKGLCEKLQKTFGEEPRWVTLPLATDRVGFARAHLARETSVLS